MKALCCSAMSVLFVSPHSVTFFKTWTFMKTAVSSQVLRTVCVILPCCTYCWVNILLYGLLLVVIIDAMCEKEAFGMGMTLQVAYFWSPLRDCKDMRAPYFFLVQTLYRASM
jgi:hypothetical protein